MQSIANALAAIRRLFGRRSRDRNWLGMRLRTLQHHAYQNGAYHHDANANSGNNPPIFAASTWLRQVLQELTHRFGLGFGGQPGGVLAIASIVQRPRRLFHQ